MEESCEYIVCTAVLCVLVAKKASGLAGVTQKHRNSDKIVLRRGKEGKKGRNSTLGWGLEQPAWKWKVCPRQGV